MSVADNITLLVEALMDTSLFVLAELIQHIQKHPVSFISTAIVAFIGYILLNFYKIKVSKNAVNKKLEIIIYITSPFIFILFTYYAVKVHTENPLYILLNYLGFYWLSTTLMKIPARYMDMKVKLYYTPAMLFIFIALAIALYVDVSFTYVGIYKKELISAFNFARSISKVFLVLGFFIYIKGVLPQALRQLKEAYPDLAFLAGLARLIVAAYLVISCLWIFNLFTLDFRAVMAVALLGMLLALLSYVFHKIQQLINHIYSRELYSELEWALIKKNSTRFIFMVFINIYYLLIYNALDMKDILEKLKGTYLFETKLFSLSILSLLSAVIVFIFLKSLLYLFTKYLRVAFSDKDIADDTDSLEIIVYNLGLLLVFMFTLLQIGITWQVVVPIAGALGIGIGFGLQTVINNYVCGFILLFSKKIRIGDFVELPGSAGNIVGVVSDSVFGSVVSIDMFATTVQTFDNIEIMVPNSVFISETIINYTRSDKYVRVRVPVGIAYSSDIELAQKLMYEAIDDCEQVVKYKGNDVWFMEYGDSSLNFMVLFWLNMSEGLQITSVKNVFLSSLWHKFKEHGIEIPFPQQDVWFRNDLKIADKIDKENDK
ncbi:MAG: hypothetical protein C0603_13060 [Denitrovibrio sp.]|nr:MAG: hypothetical protein C0603_13060 [Denitrovibrio sp.]